MIQSAKTRLGTETARAGEPGPSTKESCLVGSNQVFSSLPSSLVSSRAMIAFQKSVMPSLAFPQLFHKLWKRPSFGAGEYMPMAMPRRWLDFPGRNP